MQQARALTVSHAAAPLAAGARGLAGGGLVRRTRERVLHVASLLLLAAVCVGFSALALLLYPCLPAAQARRLGRLGIRTGFGAFAAWLHWTGAYHFELDDLDALRHAPALILAPNHPSLIDALLILSRHPQLACVMKADLMANPLFGPGARLARYIRNGATRQMVLAAVQDLRAGGSLLLFPEGTRSAHAPIDPLTRSIALIAWRAQVPVQTLLIDTDSPFLGKGWPLWRRPNLPIRYRIRLGARFEPPGDPAQIDSLMRDIERHFRAELQASLNDGWLGRPAAR